MKPDASNVFMQLRRRVQARLTGVPLIHCLPLPAQRLLYIPIPKVACSSIKRAFYYLEFGRNYDSVRHEGRHIHDYYFRRYPSSVLAEEIRQLQDVRRFAIVRDPLKRFLSAYANRVLDLSDLSDSQNALALVGLPERPDVNFFVEHLDVYRKANASLAHHTRPQSEYLGRSLDHLDDVVPIEESGRVEKWLQQHASELTLPRTKSGGTKISADALTKSNREKVLHFYQADYELLSEFYRI